MNYPAAVSIRPEARARFTTAEFIAMVEAGAFADMKVELVAGELERMPPPKSEHGARQATVMIRLARVFAEDLLMGEVGIDCGNDTILACDVAVLKGPIAGNRLLLPADVALLVEVAETTIARDLGVKRLSYALAEIPHYWVVDGSRSVVHVYADPVAGEYADIRTVRFGEPLAVPGTDATIVIG